jgi:hypothetical protein
VLWRWRHEHGALLRDARATLKRVLNPRWSTHTLNAFCFADHGHREREHDDPEHERQAAVIQLQA